MYCVLIIFISFFIILNKICGIKDAISGSMLSKTSYLVVCYQGCHIWWYAIKDAISVVCYQGRHIWWYVISNAISGGMLSRTPYLVVCFQGRHIWWYVIKDVISGGMLSSTPYLVVCYQGHHIWWYVINKPKLCKTFCMGVNEHDRKSILIQMY